MLAKSFQAITKFLILASIASTAYADINVPLSATNGVRQDYQPNGSIIPDVNACSFVRSLSGSRSQRPIHVHLTERLLQTHVNVG